MRDYDPTAGRYLEADPLGLVDGASIYGYVKGNPGRWVDPRGEFAAAAGGGAVAEFLCATDPVCAGVVVIVGCAIGAYDIYQWWNAPPNIVAIEKEPGKPGESDGFKPKKHWDGEKVKNPNGPGAGYPDQNGDVWVPTGVGGAPGTGSTGIAHGGPHWDVESPGGGYRNVKPAGGKR